MKKRFDVMKSTRYGIHLVESFYDEDEAVIFMLGLIDELDCDCYSIWTIEEEENI